MAGERHWHLISYDVRHPKRWAKVYKLLRGTGDHLQYSVFRVHLSPRQLESLRCDLEEIMEEEDDLMIIRLCASCAKRVVDSRSEGGWEPPDRFGVL